MRMNGLSRRATIRKCEDEIRLSIAGVAVHVALLCLVLAACDDIRGTSGAWFSVILMASFAASQSVIILRSRRWLRAPNGVAIWRIWTIINTQIAVIAWSSLLCYSVYYFGLSTSSIKIILICLGLAASGGTSLAFDLVNFYLYLSFMLLPLTATFFIKNDIFLALGSLLYLFYCAMTGMQIHNLTVGITKKSEQLAKNLSSLQHSFDVVRAMHGSINESFIILNSDGVCSGETSAVAKKFFPAIAEGVALWELLGKTGEAAKQLKSWFTILYMDRLDFDETAARGPQMLELDNGSLVLKLRFHPLRDENQKLKAVIFTAVDVTAEVSSQKELEEERERAAMILRISQNRFAFRSFLSRMNTAVNLMQDRQTAENSNAIKQELHTLKGAALLFGASTLATRIFNAELAIGKQPLGMADRIQAQGKELAGDYIVWRHRERQMFTQLGVFDGETIEISRGKLMRFETEIQNDKLLADSFKVFKEKLLGFEFGDLLRDFEFHIDSVATRLGKQVGFHLDPSPEPIFINAADYREPLRALIHLFNNSLDHGLENPEKRALAGKPRQGTITARYRRAGTKENPLICLEITDDGRGVDVRKLRSSLKEKGKQNVDDMSDIEIASQIFLGGISSKANVTELSGQGVGMRAVREEILKIRGKIRIVRTGPDGTMFEILLPDFSKENLALPRTAS